MSFKTIPVFNGGINNVIAAHLIQENQGQYIANCNIISGEIEAAKNPKATLSTLAGQSTVYYKAADEVVSSTEDRFYVEWAGLLYWSNSAGTLKRYDGATVLDIGNHTAPASAPTAATPAAGLLNGTYTYAVTYVHNDLFESPPCAFVTVAPANQNVVLTFTDTAPAGVTKRNIYRVGGLNPTFNLVGSALPADTTFTDNIGDFDVSRKELTSYNYDPAPTNLDMLVEIQGTFFGSVGNKVYFSKEGEPEYWSAYNYVQLPKDVAGMGVFGTSIIAFTDTEMFLISGTNINNISRTKLPFNFGCKNKRTVKNVNGMLVWIASRDNGDVICMYNGSDVQILNRFDKYFNAATVGSMAYDDFVDSTYNDFAYDIKQAIVSDRKYHLFTTGRTVIIDFENDVEITYMTEAVETAYSKGNSLYVGILENSVINEYEYLPDFSTYRNIAYRTGDISLGDITFLKEFRSINVVGEGSFTVQVVIDSTTTIDLSEAKQMLPSGTRGHTIGFVIKSTGYAKIKAIRIEFTQLKE